jgi:hypothetical protein
MEIEYHAKVRAHRFLAVAFALLAPTVAEAQSVASASGRVAAPTPATVVVDLGAAQGAQPWLADAFEQTMIRELSGFERLKTVAKEDLAIRDCGVDRTCRLRVYQQSHIDIVLFGQVTDSEIQYELYQTWTPARLSAGAIAIGRAQSAIGLKHDTRDAFHAVIKHGGLLDQRPYTYVPAAATAPRWAAFDPALALGALAVLALPFAVLAVRTRSLRRAIATRSARWIALALAALVAVAALDAALGLAELVAASPWPFAGAGGLAWGAIAIASVRRVLPPLDGLTRVAPYDVIRILRTWCLVAAQRLVVRAALWTVLAVVAGRIGDRLAVPSPWRWLLIAPVIWGLARLWRIAWVECLAIALDARLVDGAASPANPWSREIADYLMGYVRRTGWDVDRELLAQIVVLPGRGVEGAVSYGGGATHARIVVDKALLELAMGELVEVKPEDKPALWPDWTAATVVATAGQPPRAMTSVRYGGRKPRSAAYVLVRKPLGQAATLLGYVFASPGERVPLISDNPQDLAVVRELLSEHYPWNAPDPDDEFDASDPTDKDLLFGALVRELGVIQRHDCEAQTVRLALGRRAAGLGSRAAARLADAYTVLNFARDHLVQYLYYRWAGSAELATARARGDQLHEVSVQILERMRAGPATGSPALRRRLGWLSAFFVAPIVDHRAIWLGRLVAAVVLAGLLAMAGAIARRSLDYHRVYVERIETQERAAATPAAPPHGPQQKEVTHGETQAH